MLPLGQKRIRNLMPYYPVMVGEMCLATELEGYSSKQRQRFADASMTSFVENAYAFVFWSYKMGYNSKGDHVDEPKDWAFTSAVKHVRDYYCDSKSCTTGLPAPTPSPAPTPCKPTSYCGCNSCTQAIWDKIVTDSAGSYSCGSRITWLQNYKCYSEASACDKVELEFPAECFCGSVSGRTNEPTTCKQTPKPTTRKPTTTSNPTTRKPTLRPTQKRTNEPTTYEPTTNEPTTYEPTTNDPTTSMPTTTKPTARKPRSMPVTLKPTTNSKPTTRKPTTTSKPTTCKPIL
jgi:hypothetical protein